MSVVTARPRPGSVGAATGAALEPLEVPGVAELRAERLAGVQLS